MKSTNPNNEHDHSLYDGQLICDNEQCREKVREKIKGINREIRQDFIAIVEKHSKTDQINNEQAWTIVCSTSVKLSERLMILLNREEIRQVIEKFIEQKRTKKAFDDAFDHAKKKQTKDAVTKEQLWSIYLRICEEAIDVLSKTKKQRGSHTVSFLAFDQEM